MVQVSLSTTTSFDGDLNALVEDQGTSLTFTFSLDEPAPAGGLRLYLDSDVEQIVNRLDLPGFAFNPQIENISLGSVSSNFDNSGFALTIDEGATTGSFTIDIFDNPEPDTFLPETFDGLVEAGFSLKTADQIEAVDQTSIMDLSDYTIDPAAGTTTVLFADTADQLPSEPPTGNGDYDEAIDGEISDNPGSPLALALSNGETRLSASTGNGDQEYVTVTVPDGLQLASIELASYSQSDVAFVGVQEGSTFTEPLDNSADLGEYLGYSLVGVSAVGTDILDNLGNGSNGPGFGGQGFEGPLPAGTYTFAIQQLQGTSDYTLVFNVNEATVIENAVPVATDDVYEAIIPGVEGAELPTELTVNAADGVLANDSDADGDDLTVAIADTPTNGTVDLSADGSFTYTPTDGFSTGEQDSFTYTVSDGNGGSDTGSVVIEAVAAPNPPPTGDPVVSFETVPATFSEEDENNLVEWKWTVAGDFPEDGITINLDTSGGEGAFAFTEQFATDPPAEFINAEIVDSDDETGRINILLSEPEASFKLYFVNDILEEGTQEFDFQLAEGEGYTVDPETNGGLFTITDDNGGPGVGPTIGLSTSETELAEGDTLTITFTAEGEIPAEGVQVLVQSDVPGSLGQFDLADLGNITTTGIEGLPTVGDGGGGSFFITMTEPTATITLDVFDDILAEEPLPITFTVANGEEYEVAAANPSITLNISDDVQPAGPTVGLTVDKTEVTEGESITLTFAVDGEIPEEGVQVLVNDIASAQGQLRSLTEFDVANIELTGISGAPTPADGDSGFFVTLTEPTATLTIPVFDEGADEDEANESFTFELIDGEAYGVDSEASGFTLNISDAEGGTPPTGEPPVVSFEAIPANVSEEDADAQVVWQWTVTGDFPEDGITINFDTLGDNDVIAFTEQFAADPGPEFVESEIVDFDEETGRLQILLSAPSASFVLPIANDALEEGAQTFDFQLADGEGYTVDPDQNSTLLTITDDNGGPGVGPTVGISVSPTDLAEGDPLVVTFTVDGDIPAEGVEVLVQSPVAGALGQFDLADLGNITTTGIEGLPSVGDGGGGSFFITITEPTATIALNVFDDIIAEEPLELAFDLANGEEYEVDPEASGIVLNISDEPQPAGPTVGLTVDKTDVTEGESITLTFAVDGEIPEGGVQVLVNDVASAGAQLRSLTEFDVANIDISDGIDGFPTPADGDSGFFITLTEPTATLTLPVFDEGADEDEATESFTFEVIDGEAYEVDEAASSITLNIADPVEASEPTVTLDLISGTFGDEGELVTPNLIESGSGQPVLTLLLSTSEPVPEDGLIVDIETDLPDITQFIQGANFVPTAFGGEVVGALYSDEGLATGLQVRLDNRNAVVNFTTGLTRPDETADDMPADVTFSLADGEGYTPAPTPAVARLYADISQVPAVENPPEVGMDFVSDTGTLTEGGDTGTLNFTVNGDIPAEGLVVFVSNNQFAGIVDFDLLNATTTGGSFPAPDGGAGGFFFKITEPNASVTFQARVDETVEGLEQVSVALQPLPGYTIAEGAGEVSILVQESDDSKVQVGLETSPEVLIETEGTVSVHTFSLSSAPPADGVTVTVQTSGLADFDASAVELSGITDLQVLESDPEQLQFTIVDQTATISLPVADDGVTEGLEEAVFTLVEPDEDASYQVDPEASSGTFTIVDVPEDAPVAPLEETGQNDTIATAEVTGLSADNTTVTIKGEISGNFFDSDLSLRTDQTEDVDMYAVELAAGDVLRIDTDAQQFDSEADTLVRLFDAEGNDLTQNDDAAAPDELFNEGIGFDSYLEYTADTAGTYYVGISTFSNGVLDFITDPYDPNVVASGSGNSNGEYTLNLSLNQEVGVEPTVIPDGDGTGPVVSFTAIPSTLNNDAIVTNALIQSTASADESLDLTSIITLQLSAEGEIPEEGVEIFLNSNLDLSDRLSPGFGRGVEVLGAIFDENGDPTGLRINLTATTALLTLDLESQKVAPTDGVETLELSLVPSAGYQATDTLASLPIYDTLADVPPSATPLEVSITASETALVESVGNTTTLTFNLSEAPPAEGVLVYVDSEIEGVISEFNVFDAVITGADAPFPNGDVSGFYLRITEQTATLTVSAFDETTNPQLTLEQALEGIESITFSIENGDGYTVSPDSGSIDLTIADNPDSVVIPDPGNGGGEPPENPENEFNDTIETAIDTGLGADNPTFSTEATLEVTDILLNPGVPEDEELFYENLLDSTEDVDMYAFDLEAGQTITIDVDGGGTGDAGVEGSTLDSILRVFDAAGNEVAISENDGAPDEVFQANGDAYLQFTATEAGTYYAGVSVLGNTFYDPNVQGSGSGWIFDGFEPGEYRLTATLGDGTGGNVPVVGVTIDPAVRSEEDADLNVNFNFTVDGEIPEDGLSILINGGVDILDQVDGAVDIGFNDATLGDFFDPATGTFEVVLTANTGTITLPILNDVIEEADTDFTFTIVDNDGSLDSTYAVDAAASTGTVTLVDGQGGPGVGPTVGISVDNGELSEGDRFTLNFTVDGDIPTEGLQVLVDSPTFGVLGEFAIFDEDGNSAVELEGIAGLPEVGDSGGSSSLVTLTDPNASLSLDVFDDGANEGLESLTFDLINGEVYEVDPTASSITFTLNDFETVGTDAGETLVGDDADNSIDGLGGADAIAGGLGNDLILGGDGNDVLRGDLNNRRPQDNIAGGDDIIFGGEGSDRIGGKAGNDILSGNAGDDLIWGDDGDDIIMGGLGNDTLVGDNFSNGSGSDLFVFGNGDGTDTILDFEVGIDRIGLVEGELMFADLTITQDGNNALLGVTSSGETLAILNGVQASALTQSSFEVVADVSNPEEALALI
ncbi:DVUA0089 family protein [cf. Phormidesmis sp. LEGE 11477]|uniref:DVUA0089 family protein n=1 Tax=cf. Phormidesmis sp. LEGE 11477 TaxID=1828680 RepID=UPI0018808E02|nr:DVUA0089 family protein [cf. Phormidesmis sp. LEGE 11477]MBE9064303.1 DVUA0089 family protein [cf. Phormidesmis sp. LEGE 11477]